MVHRPRGPAVTGPGKITQADRVRWQQEAARELAAVLDAHGNLPVIAWTIGPAGGGLSGRISGLAPGASVRAAFTAWQQALALDDVLESASGSGAVAWLRARAWRGGVRISVTATIFTADECTDAVVTP
jgi:hypothetical protein